MHVTYFTTCCVEGFQPFEGWKPCWCNNLLRYYIYKRGFSHHSVNCLNYFFLVNFFNVTYQMFNLMRLGSL